jgi:putative pre-16S rRNA nuclease
MVIGLDLGRRRIGVALADAEGIGAYPLGTIERSSLQRDIHALKAMLQGRQISTVVVGLPVSMDGSEGAPARAARTYAGRLGEALGVPIEMFDERLTSFEAEERLKAMPVRRGAKRSAIDAIAATVILEGWLQSRASTES